MPHRLQNPPASPASAGGSSAHHARTAILIALSICTIAVKADQTKLSPAQLQFFEKQVRPLLIKNCYECHSAQSKKIKGALLLDSRQGVQKGGESGPVITTGDPEKSPLIRAIRYTDEKLQMPPDEKLAQRDIDTLVQWVREGAYDPREAAPAALSTTEKSKSWWSFQPIRNPAPPAVQNQTWPKTDIDKFILAKLEAHGMTPAPNANRRTLIRRATFDLTGLPPTPAEIDSFLADRSPDAFAHVIDRLLASPAYGQRWGRHWLDVVRYADTSGCNSDFPIPDAWRYRNYVIDSFNADKPYDQFLREQIAGDLLPYDSDAKHNEQIIATGYIPISRRFSSVAEEFHLTIDDTIDNLGKGILGLTISCARCHDHKFDPIPQTDYYALYGIFQSTKYAFPGTEIYRQPYDLTPLVSSEKLAELRPEIAKLEAMDAEMFRVYSPVETLDTGKEKDDIKAHFAKLQKERDAFLLKMPAYPKAFAASEGKATNAHVNLKGDPKKPGAEVPRGFLQILGGQTVPATETRSGRRELANWITNPANPLTARVIVNRIWLNHFGRGIVRTPDDLGTRGALPTHPELLDFLATRFMQSGWSIKSMHRQIMLSRAYQMAAIENPDYAQRDSQNDNFWTFNRRRLSAEEIRDAILFVSGALDPTSAGPHPFKPETTWRYTQHNPFVDDFPTNKRSVYLMQQRIRQQPYLGTFDGADTNAVTGQRHSDTPPQQALFMLNSEFAHKQAGLFADRLAKEAGTTPDQRIKQAYLHALGRPPANEELTEARTYIEKLATPMNDAKVKDPQHAAWTSYLRVLFSNNEFIFIE